MKPKAQFSSKGKERGPRPRDSAETRAAILRAAERIFADVGLEGARTDAIARAAGVNKAMLYYYFRSKAGLYGAVLEEHVKEFHRRALEILSSRDAPSDILLRYVSTHFDFIGARPYYPRLFQRLIMAGDARLEGIIRRHFAPLSKRILALIRRGIRRGEFRPFDAQHTAMSLVALTVFYFNAAPIVRIIGGIDVYAKAEQARRKEEVLKFIRYALFTHPEAKAQ